MIYKPPFMKGRLIKFEGAAVSHLPLLGGLAKLDVACVAMQIRIKGSLVQRELSLSVSDSDEGIVLLSLRRITNSK